MSVAENKALVRRFNEAVWNQGNLALIGTGVVHAIDELFADDWIWRSAPPGMPPNRAGLKQMATGFRAAFSDIRTTVDDQIAEGDKVAWRWAFQANHTGEFMGIPATGKQITLTGISIDRIAGGKFVERWDQADFLGLLQQLGVMPTPGQNAG